MFKRILFPVDFSPACESVAPAVAAMQDAVGSELSVLHCVTIPQTGFTEDGVEWICLDALGGIASQKLTKFVSTYFPGRQPRIAQEIGDVAQAICRRIDSDQIDLVMMPTHGYGIFRRALLGSVTAKVLHDARCAVWTAAHTESVSSRPLHKILCAVGDLQHTELLQSAHRLAETLAANLTIVHVYPYFAETPDARYPRRVPRRDQEHIQENIERLQRQCGTHSPVVIACGEVEEVIAETARRCDADLVIAGRGRYGNFLGALESHLYDTVRSSMCPVITFPRTQVSTTESGGRANTHPVAA